VVLLANISFGTNTQDYLAASSVTKAGESFIILSTGVSLIKARQNKLEGLSLAILLKPRLEGKARCYPARKIWPYSQILG
jgi:hypothetical protein